MQEEDHYITWVNKGLSRNIIVFTIMLQFLI